MRPERRQSVLPNQLVPWSCFLFSFQKLCYGCAREKQTFGEVAQGTMTGFVRMLLAVAILTAAQIATSCGAEMIRIASQKTGTLAWELAVIRAHGLDKKANLTIDVVELASPEAGKIALRAGNADIIVSD